MRLAETPTHVLLIEVEDVTDVKSTIRALKRVLLLVPVSDLRPNDGFGFAGRAQEYSPDCHKEFRFCATKHPGLEGSLSSVQFEGTNFQRSEERRVGKECR